MKRLVLFFSAMVTLMMAQTARAQSDRDEGDGDAMKLEKPYKWEMQNAKTIPVGGLYKTEAQTWNAIGPNPMYYAFYGNVSGRITSLAVDPTNSNIVYAAAADGGLWKTTDGGTSWTPLTDNFPRISSGSVAIDPNNSSTIYYGTGELNFNIDGYPGSGVWKSTDGGTTWNQILATASVPLYYTGKIVVASNGTVYASGLYDSYKSTDGGSSWTKLNLTNGTVDDIVVDPKNPGTIYASYGSTWTGDSLNYGIHKSTNGGTSWTWLTSGLPPASQISRASIAIAPSNNQVLYAFINGTNPKNTATDTNRVYTSTNGGASWSVLPAPSNSNNGFGGNQGWYNNVIAVDPTHPDTVYVGGIDFWRSSNGGQTWTNLTNGYGSYTGKNIHVDQHAIAFANGNGAIFYIGNDGGVWKTTDGSSSFANANTNLQTIQFYDIDADQINSGITVGGTQDNGTESGNQSSTKWNEIYGGDGGYVIIDPKNSNIIYTEYVNGQIFKSTNGGSNFNQITNGISEAGYWLTPYVMDPTNDNLLYCGTSKIYKTTNGGTNWSAISGDLKSSSDLFTTMAISQVEGNAIYAGISGYRGAADTSFLFVTTNGGSSWNNVTSKLPTETINGQKSLTDFARVTADPKQKGVAYLAVLTGSNRVLKTTDYGNTWNPIASASVFGSAPAKVISVDSSTGNIYAGTYAGVYRSTDNGNTWAAFGSGLPNSVVDDIAIQYSTNALRVGTHGRGVWQVNLITGIAEQSGTPYTFAMNQNYPNPFNPSTNIEYQIADFGFVSLKVYDVLGREVTTLVNEKQNAGTHVAVFDGSRLPSGVYFYRLIAGALTSTKKMVLMK